jgi:hypothetical protein
MLADNLPSAGDIATTLQPMTTQRIAEALEPANSMLDCHIAVIAAQLLVCK